MEHDIAIIVHAENESEAIDTARTTANRLCQENVFSFVDDIGSAHEIPERWIGDFPEENYPTILRDAPDTDVLATYIRTDLEWNDEAIATIHREAEESTTVGAEDVFAKEEIMENFQRIGQTRGHWVSVYEQNADGITTARDLKYALSTGDYANDEMIERGYRPFVVEVSVE